MRFRLSQHAKDEALRRQIPLPLIDSVLESPEQIVTEKNGRKAYQSKLGFGDGKIFLLRAIVLDMVDPAIVVTVYRTTKIAKYWRL